MAIFTRLDDAAIDALLQPYGLRRLHSEGIREGTVNTYYRLETDKGVFYLRIDERGDAQAVKGELALLDTLRALSVPHPLWTQKNERFVHCGKKPVILFTAVPGVPMPADTLGKAELTQIGDWLATLHTVRPSPSLPLHRFHMSYLRTIYLSIEKRARAEASETIPFIEDALNASVYTFPGLPESIIHADLFSENLHFDKGHLVGVLDFEAAGRGPRLLDLAIAMQALCFDLTPNRFDLVKVEALSRAYLKHLSPTDEEKTAWPELLRYSALRFLITRLKDFEFSTLKPHEGVWKDYREYLAHFQDLPALHHILA